MPPDVTELVRQAVRAAAEGNPSGFLASINELERRGWDESGVYILEALMTAVDELPSWEPDDVAALTRRASERFRDSLDISLPVMEAEIRSASGDEGLVRGIPRDLGLVHSLLAVGQIIHEGRLTLVEALDPPSPEEQSTNATGQGAPTEQ